jgi:predicted RNA methylase
VRDRPLEFSDATRQPKAEVLKKFDQAIEVVSSAVNSQTADDWSKEYTAVGAEARDRLEIVLQCATHLHHHMGQMLYLGFEFKRKS